MWQSLGRDNRGTFREVETGCLCGAFPVLSTHYPWKQQKNLTLDVTLHPTERDSRAPGKWDFRLPTPEWPSLVR